MRRRLLLFSFSLLMLIISVTLSAQSVIWEEVFDSMPQTWQMDGNWSIAESALTLSWNPEAAPFDFTALSPEVVVPDNPGDLIVTQYIDDYMDNQDERVEIIIISGETETVLWSFDMVGNDWGDFGGQDISFDLSPYTGQTVQFKFRCYGSNSFNINFWYVYNVAVTAIMDNDLAAREVTGEGIVNVNSDNTWEVKVRNTGSNPANNFTVKLMELNGNEIGSQLITDELASGAEIDVPFDWTPVCQGEKQLYGQVIYDNDEYEGNNNSSIFTLLVYPENAPFALIWDNEATSFLEGKTGTGHLEETLTNNLVNFETVMSLPDDLSPYDIVFVALGVWCLS